MNTPDLNAAAEAVTVAREVCRKAAAHLAELSSDDGRISVAKLDRSPGAGLRPGPRHRRRRGRGGDVRVRQPRRPRGPAGLPVHRRGDLRPRRPPRRPGGRVGCLGHGPRPGRRVRQRPPLARVPGGRGRGGRQPRRRLALAGRGVRARPRHVPPLRRRQGPAGGRAGAPEERRHPRGRHRRAGRDRRLRSVGPGGVRRVRRRRRERLPRHGHRHRGAVVGQPQRRRLAHHPAGDPHPGAGAGRHRGPEEGLAAPASPPARRWSA